MGCERVGELAKGGGVAGRPGARVDGYSPPPVKKVVLQVSKNMEWWEARGWVKCPIKLCVNIVIYDL
jgi:hypothetical protein